MIVEEGFPSCLVLLGSCVTTTIVDLGGVFESYAMIDVVGNISNIRETMGEKIRVARLHLCILLLKVRFEG
ncbi:hypothetical protein N866_16255 [Actinotalea ferrariae CF5-4]|uniref:Uncharacterized protein n=1 Tax=Actinotalea ferrariae CF5-4 TaxID=948458 RepID=A0A021VP00_9CELL|nr:hypothetical protein N866_16255 [Actinotalea ferrariae CF5-4]